MTRQKATDRIDLGLENDYPYRGSLRKPKEGWLQKSNGRYGERMQLVVEWDIARKDGFLIRDWVGLTLSPTAAGVKSKLHRLLNALAEQSPDAEPWWDSDTLEWGYDPTDGSPAYAQLTEGLVVIFKGEKGKNDKGQSIYRITSYKSPARVKNQ